jgi:SSS family solute:Na+ symporter
VNRVGSFFYGTMLAIFLCAFYAHRVGGTAMLWGALVAETAVVLCARYTEMAWLWWNVVGCVVGVVAAMVIQAGMNLRGGPREELLTR